MDSHNLSSEVLVGIKAHSLEARAYRTKCKALWHPIVSCSAEHYLLLSGRISATLGKVTEQGACAALCPNECGDSLTAETKFLAVIELPGYPS